MIPLAFRGNREELCANKTVRTLFVHDWIWRRRGKSRVISWLLLKRLNRWTDEGSVAPLCVRRRQAGDSQRGYDLEWSLRTPLALFWQDAVFVLGFALLERVPRSRFVIAGLYWSVALYVALNVPVVRMFSTPLTLPMLRATRGTLADSIGHHVDIANLASIGLVLATAVIAPIWLPPRSHKAGTDASTPC